MNAFNNLSNEEYTEEFNRVRDEGKVEFITFHPSYSYEEFIEGITVDTESESLKSGNLGYVLKEGIFKKICKRALAAVIGMSINEANEKKWIKVYNEYLTRKDEADFTDATKFVLIIDEINRGDMAKIFGELITLLETDKRLKAENELIVTLPASGDFFGVPPNIYIIATMNTADRSIALLDVALRRRFGFIEMNPDYEVLEKECIAKNKDNLEKEGIYELMVNSKESIKIINERISGDKAIGRDRQIGHSFFFNVSSKTELLLVWKYEILPLLEEYCYSNYTKINNILFEKEDTKWINEAEGIKYLNIDNLDKMIKEINESRK
jgi:5-methylcytosine-specific restriction protein B|tara:strand:+ start:1736 stop:2707 length:972 start_codon:yes stop_codon:yes gene_type:complete